MKRDLEKARAFEQRGRGGLRPDPETVRAFINRTRENARERAKERERERVGAKLPRPASTLRPTARKRKATIPKTVRRRVMARSDWLCICGCGQRATQIHHVLDENKFPELALVEDNLVAVHHDCHANHTGAHRRLRREALPQCAVRLAETNSQYEVHLERSYPVGDLARRAA